MAKILVKATVSQLISVDPANYGQRDDVFDLEDAVQGDLTALAKYGLSLDDLFDVTAETFSLKYEEAGE
jgi:hypothetical protein